MKLKEKNITYISSHNPIIDPGVEKKIRGFCAAAQRANFSVVIENINCCSLKDCFKLGDRLINSDSKLFIIRSFNSFNLFLFFYYVVARVQGKVLILDQPTPLKAYIIELQNSSKVYIKKLLYILLTYLNGPWVFWVFNRIIEYAQESSYFLFCNRNRTLLLGNGIELGSTELRCMCYQNIVDRLDVLGIANVSPHHGYDRVIRAVAKYNSSSSRKAYFTIIGGKDDSAIIKELKALTVNLKVEEYVTFCGFRDTQYINNKYNTSHIAIGSLGLWKLGLNESSILKIREYCAVGIPFITAGDDPDFPNKVPFRLVVPNDNSIDGIVNIFCNYEQIRQKFTDKDIRDYAFHHLSYDVKIQQILSGLI